MVAMARSEWVERDKMKLILALLTYENQLAIELSLRYGMRIGDVLNIKTEQARKGLFSYREEKTGKRRRIKLNKDLQSKLLSIGGKIYVFENRIDWKRHRTRQAVYKDIVRASKALRLAGCISCHSARKIYAVDKYKATGYNLKKVQQLLNHSDEAVTMIYALADKL